MQFHQYSYTIADHFASALINGDNSGLTDSDQKEFEQFLASAPYGVSHWDIAGDGCDNFAKCEITDLYANCVEARAFVPVEVR